MLPQRELQAAAMAMTFEQFVGATPPDADLLAKPGDVEEALSVVLHLVGARAAAVATW